MEFLPIQSIKRKNKINQQSDVIRNNISEPIFYSLSTTHIVGLLLHVCLQQQNETVE